MTIQILLLAALGAAGLLLTRRRSAAFRLLVRRGVVAVALVAGVLAVLFPDALTVVARSVGVGRGADLLLYGLAVSFVIVVISLHQRLGEMHDRFVVVSRRVAQLEADLARRDQAV